MKLIVASIFISMSLLMFFINGIVSNVAGDFLEVYENPFSSSIVSWIPWLTMIIGLYFFFIYIFEKKME
ncbi:hypothetical protein [Mesobacillus sp.]|uniref:hypothetical protein n=1 Tax=Mesobacillus sp. TaxID=2675271 RepID=UPI0039EFC204